MHSSDSKGTNCKHK